MDKVLKTLTLDYFGSGCHKITPSKFLSMDKAVFVDVREIPRDMFVGLFCPANIRSTIAMVYLMYKGYEQVRVIEGGYAALTDEMKPGKVLKLVQEKDQ